MKLHRELGIGQKAAWFMLQRLRKAADEGISLLRGLAEVDETYVGGRRKNMPKREKLEGRGPVGKDGRCWCAGPEDEAGAGRGGREHGRRDATGLRPRDGEEGRDAHTDDARAYNGLTEYDHDSVKHSVGKYVKDVDVHANGIESQWSMFKRGYIGTFHKMSPKHLDRYAAEFERPQNLREEDTLVQMGLLVTQIGPKRLRYRGLIADSGLPSGARSA